MPSEYPEDPVVGVGAVIVKNAQVLLVRRANAPGSGRWSIPGGRVELGETLAQAAAREGHEECGVKVAVGPVISTCDLIQSDETGRIRYHYVLVDVAARHICGEPRAGTDALESRWVKEADLNQLDIVERLLPVLRKALREECDVAIREGWPGRAGCEHR